jgi:hypothetical protein
VQHLAHVPSNYPALDIHHHGASADGDLAWQSLRPAALRLTTELTGLSHFTMGNSNEQAKGYRCRQVRHAAIALAREEPLQALRLENGTLAAQRRARLPSMRILIVSFRAKWRAFFATPAWAERVEDQEEDFYAWQDSAD